MLTEEQKLGLKRLLELRKKQEKDNDDVAEMNRLNAIYDRENSLTNEQLQEKLDVPTSLTFQSKGDLELIIQAYTAQFSKNPGFKPHETKNGMTTLFFATEAEAVDFAIAQAKAGRKFQIVDEKHCVLAYSNGDGKLYHADNKEFKKGEPFMTPVIPAVPTPLAPSTQPTEEKGASAAPAVSR